MTASEYYKPTERYDFKLAKSASACTTSSSSGQWSSKGSIHGDRDGKDVMSQQDLQSAIANNEAMQLFLGAAGVYRDEEDIGKQSSFEGDDSGTRTRVAQETNACCIQRGQELLSRAGIDTTGGWQGSDQTEGEEDQESHITNEAVLGRLENWQGTPEDRSLLASCAQTLRGQMQTLKRAEDLQATAGARRPAQAEKYLESIKSDIMKARVWTVAFMDILGADDRKQSLGGRPSAACGETLDSHFTGVGE